MSKIFKNKKCILLSLLASSLAVGSMLVISTSLTSCSENKEEPQIGDIVVQEDGYYLNNLNPDIQNLKVYTYTDPKTATKTFRFVNVTDALSNNFGFTGWTLFGANVEKNGLNATFDNKDLYIPETIVADGVVHKIVNVTAFTGNETLEYVHCSKEIQTIGLSAFSSCTNLIEFNLPETNNLTTINDFAFNYCDKLNTFDFNKAKLSIIGEAAFSQCFSLKSKIVISSAITLIRNNAFYYVPVSSIEVEENNYYALASPKSVGAAQIVIKKELSNPSNAFDYSTVPAVDTGLVCGQLTIDPDATQIADQLFSNKVGLVGKINIPAKLTMIGFDAFAGCNISGVEIDPGNSTFTFASKETVGDAQIVVETIDKEFDYSMSMVVGSLAFGNITIPETTSEIEQFMFAGCSGLTGTINFPDALVKIGNLAFGDCSNLEKITFNDDSLLETIGNNAFLGCTKLSGVIKIPKFVTVIGNAAFRLCKNISGVDFSSLANNNIKISDDCFKDCSSIAGELVISNNISAIGNGAFSGCSNITSLNLSNAINLEVIDEYAFSECDKLSGDLIIGSAITFIGKNSFENSSLISSLSFKNENVISLVIDNLASIIKNSNCEKIYVVNETAKTNYTQYFMSSELQDYVSKIAIII